MRRSVAILFLLGATGRPTLAVAEEANACGCYRESTGSCLCTKVAKCGCPGECEPMGCEEKRAKLLEREIQAETKKAARAGKLEPNDSSAGGSPPPNGEVDRVKRISPVKPKRPRMTTAQKRDLRRLLDIYVQEHELQGDRTIDQLRAELPSG